MTAHVIVFPFARIKRIVEPTWHPDMASLAWYLRLTKYTPRPTVQQGYCVRRQHDPLWADILAHEEQKKAKSKTRRKPRSNPSPVDDQPELT